MRLCISSVLTASILITVMILLTYPLMRCSRCIKAVGTSWIVLFLGCILARMLFPVEFFYTYTFRFTRFFTWIRTALVFDVMPGQYTVCVYQLLLIGWAAGSMIDAYRKISAYRRVRRQISMCESELPEPMKEIVRGLSETYPELRGMRVVEFAGVGTPMLMGIRRQKIILPERDFSEKELKYILAHEVLHVRNRDTIWKLLVDLMCTIYWWNYAFKLFREEAFNFIEIKNDMRLTAAMSEEEKQDYLQCLFEVAKISRQTQPQYLGTVAFSSRGGKELARRFSLVMEGAQGKAAFRRLLYALIVGVTFLSSCVIFEPHFLPEDAEIMTELDTVIRGGKDGYKVYLNGEYAYTTDSLEGFSEDVIIIE